MKLLSQIYVVMVEIIGSELLSKGALNALMKLYGEKIRTYTELQKYYILENYIAQFHILMLKCIKAFIF